MRVGTSVEMSVEADSGSEERAEPGCPDISEKADIATLGH